MSMILPAGMMAFFVAAFALPTEAAYSLVYYISVMAPAALGWRCLRQAGKGGMLALALIAWSGLTLLWGEDDGRRGWHFALGTVATASFVLVLGRVVAEPRMRRRLATVLVWAATGHAACVLLWHAPALLRGERILGWGVTRQPILGGSVMAAACLTAIWKSFGHGRNAELPVAKNPWAPRPRYAWLRPYPYPAAALVMGGFVLAMQSRGALLGFCGGWLVLMWSRWRFRALVVFAAVTRGVITAGPRDIRHPLSRMILERGTSHRPEIWARSWALIKQRPVFGHGLAANLPVSPTGFPHSLYLSLLFYSGAIGFALFAILAAMVTHRLIRAALGSDRIWVAALWVNALAAGLTDFGQITKGPGPLWFILWLPVVLGLCVPLRPPGAGAGLPAAAR